MNKSKYSYGVCPHKNTDCYKNKQGKSIKNEDKNINKSTTRKIKSKISK